MMSGRSSNKCFLVGILLVLGLALSPVSTTANPNITRQAMADAMVRMMEAMGMFGSGSGSAPSQLPFGQSWSGSGMQMPYSSMFQFPYMGGFPMPGQSGWASSIPGMDGPEDWVRMMQRYGGHFGAGTMPFLGPDAAPRSPYGGLFPRGSWYATPLDGLWEGRSGELLVIQGPRFRIYAGEVRYVDGLIQLQNDALTLYNPEEEHAQSFEYAEFEGRLVMRDPAGQLYLYRRVFLDSAEQPMRTHPPEAPAPAP